MYTAKLSEEGLKNKAKKVRQFIEERHGLKIPHGQCLDLVSIIYGFKNWNTASAKILTKAQSTATGEKIDTIGKLREEIAHLPDKTPIDADYTLDTREYIRELEEGQTESFFEFSFSLSNVSDKDFATFSLKLEHESASF